MKYVSSIVFLTRKKRRYENIGLRSPPDAPGVYDYISQFEFRSNLQPIHQLARQTCSHVLQNIMPTEPIAAQSEDCAESGINVVIYQEVVWRVYINNRNSSEQLAA